MIRRDDRGVTAPLEYVYTFAIAAILITGLIIGATNAAGDQRKRTVAAQMNVVAEQVAGSLEQADRIIAASDGTGTELSVDHELPDELLGQGYFVTISNSGEGAEVTVSTQVAETEISTQVELEATSVPASDQVVDGGRIEVRYSAPDLVVENA